MADLTVSRLPSTSRQTMPISSVTLAWRMFVTTLKRLPSSQMSGCWMSLGGYINHKRRCVGGLAGGRGAGVRLAEARLAGVRLAGRADLVALVFLVLRAMVLIELSFQPPAIAGMMLISSPSFKGVC